MSVLFLIGVIVFFRCCINVWAEIRCLFDNDMHCFQAVFRYDADEPGAPFPTSILEWSYGVSCVSPGDRLFKMMDCMNTPVLETERLVLRRFTEDDLDALFDIYSDEEVNTYLPWFPLRSMEEARIFFDERYGAVYRQSRGYHYAICLKCDGVPIGYVHAGTDESHDLGYGLRKEFWHQGMVTEACQAVVQQLKTDGVPYMTATHDVKNPRSGGVMRQLGMQYRYSYEEQWQPKDVPVVFRMYQLNFDGQDERVYRAYWDRSAVRFREADV